MARCLGGVDGALHVEGADQFQGLASLGSDCCPQDIFDGREATLHRDREVAREEEAEWICMFTWEYRQQ